MNRPAATRRQLADRHVTIGDRTYTLRFSVRAMAALQDHWKLASFKAVGERMATMGDSLGVDDLVGILWAGMRTHHPELTHDDVLDMIDSAGMDGLMEAITSALSGALPDAGEAAPKGKAPAPFVRKTGRSRAS